MTQATIRIGTRGSPLALAQANETRARLCAAHAELAEDAVEIVVIKTSGDRIQDRALAEAGGKGLFTKEIEEALLDGRIDIAVHSMKDMPTVLPDGLEISCLLEREDPRDAFISLAADSLAALPAGALVGSASLRRQAQIRRLRPDLRVDILRGNVDTRLRKLKEGQVDATLLANAGLRRLGLTAHISSLIEPEEMLPAVAQGAIGIEQRASDDRVRALLAPLNHTDTAVCVAAERAFLAALDGSCRTPIAGLALLDGAGLLAFKGEILRPDGSQSFTAERTGAAADAAELGLDAGEALRRQAPSDFFVAGD